MAAEAPPLLRLQRGTFDARAAVPLAGPSWLASTAPGQYAIVQLSGPITEPDRAALEATGLRLLEYLPDYAYLARGTADQLTQAEQLPQVYARTAFTLADKLAPALLRAIARGETDLGPVRVIGWPDDSGALTRDLQAQGLAARLDATAAQAALIARLESVRWLEPAGQPRLLNDVAGAILGAQAARDAHGLFGAGQIVAIVDSGLDTGELATLSPDFAGRIEAAHVLSTTVADWGDGHGHGTHVAGSLLGAGVQSGAITATQQYAGSFAGVAPEARLVVQATDVGADNAIIGLPDDYYPVFAQAYADGARIHSDSWGDVTGPVSDTEAAYGGYPFGAQRTDQFVYDHPDMTLVVAAGNSGTDGTPVPPFGFCPDGDGVVDPDSLLAPATAKNVLTVGASESTRSTGLLAPFPWLLLIPCFSTQPIALDLISNNANGLAPFSSRGPADDGRMKPDLVAPGTNIVSSQSHYPGAGTSSGPHESNPHYAYSFGTSMATPLVAGAATLTREWLAGQGAPNPSAALVKAVLLNTARDMAPGQYGTGPTQEIPLARPNSVAGWGRADLGFVVTPPPFRLWFDDHAPGLTTGASVSYTHIDLRPLEVLSSGVPLRAMLVWTDPPASLSAAAQLVNDLDLVVTGPGGTHYPGNDVVSGDRTNNVEGVVISNPPPGLYTVEVRAFNVPVGSQTYALAVSGGFLSLPVTGGHQLHLPVIMR
jgi:subtilisin family serine protease